MPPFEKSPPELVARFDAVAGRHPEAQRRKMFGYPALFVGGNLVTSLFAATWTIRLSEADLAELLELPGASPFSPVPERTMKGYGTLPADVIADDAALNGWLKRAIALGKTLPAK
ncbi:MAG TPA: TfoX/Sxy family protein [Methylomirabilota bacterium]|nr:TfoX/Sxy family protein [Methylomirabilota bacterium]